MTNNKPKHKGTSEIRLQLKIESNSSLGHILQWLDDEAQNKQERILEAAHAFWYPLALKGTPFWGPMEAAIAIARLQRQIVLIQDAFGLELPSIPALNPVALVPQSQPELRGAGVIPKVEPVVQKTTSSPQPTASPTPAAPASPKLNNPYNFQLVGFD